MTIQWNSFELFTICLPNSLAVTSGFKFMPEINSLFSFIFILTTLLPLIHKISFRNHPYACGYTDFASSWRTISLNEMPLREPAENAGLPSWEVWVSEFSGHLQRWAQITHTRGIWPHAREWDGQAEGLGCRKTWLRDEWGDGLTEKLSW